MREKIYQNPSKFDLRDYLKPAREAAKKVCVDPYLAFGCEGQAGKIKPVSPDKIAEKYKSGELAQIVR
jgi:fructose-bisphosphate aldolase, class II